MVQMFHQMNMNSLKVQFYLRTNRKEHIRIGDRFYPNMQTGNRHQGGKLLRVFADSVRMRWQGEVLVIGKE